MKIKYDYLYAVEYSKPSLMDEYGYKYVILVYILLIERIMDLNILKKYIV